MNIDKALEAARRVEQARAALKLAEDEFAAVTTGRPEPRKPIRGKTNGPTPSVSQRVLNLIVDSGPAGISRKDIVSVVGKVNGTAVHSALKVHQSKGRVQNKGGQWMATAALVRQLQAPVMTADAALLGVG